VTGGFAWAGQHLACDLPGARALFTTRRGGVSSGPYCSLNLGLGTDDDPAAVRENRRRVAALAERPTVGGRQVHGAAVRRVTAADPPRGEPADGQATARADLAPVVLTADCLPVALAGGDAVAMLHCGWRPLATGIVAEGVRAIRELGEDGPLAAAIGPGAGGCCYEVGDEVREAFAAHGGAVRRGRNLDLKEVARRELIGAGVAEVHDARICTLCGDPELWFSHRRDGGRTGRQAGLVWSSR
jgi:YfiH family protein